MNELTLNPIYNILINKYLRKVMILLPLAVMLILTMFMVMINHGTIDMELTNFMAGLFLSSLAWFIIWVLIIIHTKNEISRHSLRQQISKKKNAE